MQPDFAANVKDQAQIDNDQLQSGATQTAPSSTAGRVAAPQAQVRSNANGTSRATGHEEKTPTASAATVANAAPIVTPAPIEITPVPVLPVPSPTSVEPSEDNDGTQKSGSASPVTAAQGDDNRAVRGAHVASSSQEKLPALDVKVASESSIAGIDTAIQSDDATSGPASCAATFSVPQGVTSASPSLSGAVLSGIGLLPGAGEAGQLTANTASSSKVGDSTLSKNAAAANAAGATGNSQTAPTPAPANTSAHNASSTIQGNATVEHSQAQTAQAAPATQGPASTTAPQIQVVAAQGTTHDAAPSRSSANATPEITHASERAAQPEINASSPTQGINTANVIQKMNETEMRVGMHSAEFGEISIRTSVSQQQMMAQISVDHGDLGKAISAHIPAMEAKLGGEFGIRALVQVNQSGMSFSGERGASPQREQTRFSQTAQSEATPVLAETDSATPWVTAVASDGYRLDIRA